MTNLPRFALSADPGQAHYFTAPILNHEPPETFEGFTWFVVVCNPKCERRAQLGLRRAGYQTYLPQTKRWVVHARKKEERENPLFPRYLFIGIKPGQDFFKMRGVDGVEGLVRDGYGVPARIPAPEPREGQETPPHPLARLLERELAGEFDFAREPEKGPTFEPGEPVVVTSWAFERRQALVLSMLSKGRVEVLIDMFGRGARVKLKATELQRLEAAE
ncbi:transcription termination/antitermination protein NusG [Microvirga sp. Mcv34]|uniref:transcription termination/antitermination protein NusG n=1 Tax=Microvirga sp. Mcv34 TaxID=2926016 RepID=UPI0021C78A49|nr:transcription termination/antitermination NusG family protein [Microvirga sp. Mcv34]